jgi:hypothetical protein
VNVFSEVAVRGTGTDEKDCDAPARTNRRITERLPKFLLNLNGCPRTEAVLSLWVERRKALLRARARDPDLVLRHMAGACVVLWKFQSEDAQVVFCIPWHDWQRKRSIRRENDDFPAVLTYVMRQEWYGTPRLSEDQ